MDAKGRPANRTAHLGQEAYPSLLLEADGELGPFLGSGSRSSDSFKL